MIKRKSVFAEGGFTFVELMIVIAVIGILAAVAMPSYFNYLSRSRQSKAIGELMAMKAAQERFFAENGRYSPNLDRLDTYAVTSGTYTAGYYQYWVVGSTSVGFIDSGTIRARGDLNSDGFYNDGWEVSIEDLLAKPKQYNTGGDEGFSFSFLGSLLD